MQPHLSTVSTSELPSTKELCSYWNNNSKGPWRWWRDRNIFLMKRGWVSWDSLACRREISGTKRIWKLPVVYFWICYLGQYCSSNMQYKSDRMHCVERVKVFQRNQVCSPEKSQELSLYDCTSYISFLVFIALLNGVSFKLSFLLTVDLPTTSTTSSFVWGISAFPTILSLKLSLPRYPASRASGCVLWSQKPSSFCITSILLRNGCLSGILLLF